MGKKMSAENRSAAPWWRPFAGGLDCERWLGSLGSACTLSNAGSNGHRHNGWTEWSGEIAPPVPIPHSARRWPWRTSC